MFTQRHYKAIAEVLRESWPFDADSECQAVAEDQHERVISHLAYLFTADNYRFNRARFIEACGKE